MAFLFVYANFFPSHIFLIYLSANGIIWIKKIVSKHINRLIFKFKCDTIVNKYGQKKKLKKRIYVKHDKWWYLVRVRDNRAKPPANNKNCKLSRYEHDLKLNEDRNRSNDGALVQNSIPVATEMHFSHLIHFELVGLFFWIVIVNFFRFLLNLSFPFIIWSVLD